MCGGTVVDSDESCFVQYFSTDYPVTCVCLYKCPVALCEENVAAPLAPYQPSRCKRWKTLGLVNSLGGDGSEEHYVHE